MQFSVDAVMADEVDHQDAVVADQVDLAVLMSEEDHPDILEVMEHHHKLQNHKDGIWLEVIAINLLSTAIYIPGINNSDWSIIPTTRAEYLSDTVM